MRALRHAEDQGNVLSVAPDFPASVGQGHVDYQQGNLADLAGFSVVGLYPLLLDLLIVDAVNPQLDPARRVRWQLRQGLDQLGASAEPVSKFQLLILVQPCASDR